MEVSAVQGQSVTHTANKKNPICVPRLSKRNQSEKDEDYLAIADG